MKIKYDDNTIFDNEDDFKDFIIHECDGEYLEDFINDTYDGYEDNLNEWTPAEIYYGMVGDLEPIRDDEDLFEYLTDCYDSEYLGFDAEDYEGAASFDMCGITFDIIYEDGELEEDEEDESEE